MRIMKTAGRRGRGDFFWTVDGVASFGRIEDAAGLAIAALCDAMKAAPVATIWTQYARAA